MALTGKDVLATLGIDETHVSDIGLPGVHAVISLRNEGILLELRTIARWKNALVGNVAISREALQGLIDSGRAADERNGFNSLPDPLGGDIRLALGDVYAKLQALLELANEA